MRKLVLAIVAGWFSVSIQAGDFIGGSSKAKMLTIASTGTQAASPDLELAVSWTDFESMRACRDAIALMTTAANSTVYVDVDGVDGGYESKSFPLPKKVGPQGNAVEYAFRCVPNSGRYTYYDVAK